MANLLARKPLNLIMSEASETGEHSLKRALGAGNLISLGIGAIIGTGIFVLTGAAAAQYAGPAIVFSFILAAAGCVFAGLCYAEFASMIPVAGSAYTYGYATLGEIFAWIIGWDLILEYAFGAATVASGWSGYVLSLLQDVGIHIPPSLAGTPGAQFVMYNGRWEAIGRISKTLALNNIDPATLPHATGVFNLVAFLGIAIVTTILVIGIKESANLNSFIVVVKVAVLLVFIGLGAHYILQHTSMASENWTPFLPANEGAFGRYGLSGVVRAAGVIFFAYIGFDAVSTAAQEAKNPKRDMPIGILGSLAICTLLYILMSLTVTGLAHYSTLGVPHPVSFAVANAGPSIAWLEPYVNVAAVVGLGTVVLVLLYGQSRIFYSMASDNLLPPMFAAVHPKFRTPW